MDIKFFFTFVGIALALELLSLGFVVSRANRHRSRGYSSIDDRVIARQTKSGVMHDERYISWASYEWTYQGKTHRHTFYDSPRALSALQRHASYWQPPTGGYPAETELVVSRKTGELKQPEGERRVTKLVVLFTVGATVLAYILAKIICS